MDREQFLGKVKTLLSEVFGDRLQGVVLYGSEARGEAQPDSDIDLLVLLTGVKDWGRDLKMIIETLYPLQLQVENFRPISALPAEYAAFQAGAYALYRNARREGIVA
ncbi:MAG: nucleotidyltransferase domain-containing protein [Thermodesulfobacteriota bacterium]